MIDAAAIQGWITTFADVVEDKAAELTKLDSAIGDADHGANMKRGTAAAAETVDELVDAGDATPGALCKQVGMKLVSTVGGASGPLYGTFFLRMAGPLADAESADAATFGAALRAGLEGVIARGKAELGDKTMVDALSPACDAYDEAVADGDLGAALAAAADAAEDGRDATTPMEARKGRASYLGERSVGHQDPGATSTALMLRAAADSMGA